MRRILITCLLLIASFGCAPKLSTSGHYKNLQKVMDATSKGNYDLLGETLPTDFWLAYNKENYLQRLEELGQVTGPIIIKNLNIIDVTDLIKSNGKYFQIIDYSVDLEINTSSIPANIIDHYISTFGAEKTKLDSVNNRLYVENESQMLAVYEKELDQWKYMEISLPSVSKVYGLETSLDLEEYVR